MTTPSEGDNFEESGPRHLDKPDWSNPSHRRSIAASLVKGVYVLERERQEKRDDSNALAPQWWKFFKFNRIDTIVDNHNSIIAAVFENQHITSCSAPAAVVAFRGTILKPKTICKDLELDLKICTNCLHKSHSFRKGLDVVRSIIDRHEYDNSKIWLAGHSLGAALSMAIGRKICEEQRFPLDCYLFNPPFPSVPVQRIPSQKVKSLVQQFNIVRVAGLAMTTEGRRLAAQNAPGVLHEWIPNLFVNPRDGICAGYVEYFKNSKRMQKSDLGKKIVDIASRHSHMIPSATLNIVKLNPSSGLEDDHCIIRQLWSGLQKVEDCIRQVRDMLESDHGIHQLWAKLTMSHGIHQWWSPDLQFECTPYKLGNSPLRLTK